MRRRAVGTPLWVKALVTTLLIGVTSFWLADRHDRIGNEDRLAAIASEITGREVGVSCPGLLMRWLTLESTDTLAGTVEFDGDGRPAGETKLRERPCAELDALAEGRRDAELACAERSTSCGDSVQRVAWSLDTITHEAWHLYGIANEAEAECRAVQTNAWAGMRLGLTEEQARGLARLHYEAIYQQKPDQYRSGDCRDGGAMDMRPDDSRWP
jgi:hypothetical protein